jgi:hypothetical protein
MGTGRLMVQRALASWPGALVARGNRGVLLSGDSFAGKSTLAYACARAGWTFVCDDSSELVLARRDRYAVGNPYGFHLREHARCFFPELAEWPTTIRPNGKIGLEVFTRTVPIAIAPGSPVEHVVFLNRQETGPATIRPYSKDQALEQRWQWYGVYGTREMRAAQERCYRRLLEAGVWELRYAHLEDAIVRLERLVDSGE